MQIVAHSVAELDRLARNLPGVFQELESPISLENAGYSESVRPFLGGEMRLIRTIRHVVLPDMLTRVARP